MQNRMVLFSFLFIVLTLNGCGNPIPEDDGTVPHFDSNINDGSNNNNNSASGSGSIYGTYFLINSNNQPYARITAWADRDIQFFGPLNIVATNGSFVLTVDIKAIYSIVATATSNGSNYKGIVGHIRPNSSVTIPMRRL